MQEKAKEMADRIFSLLQTRSEWSIDRCRIVGGFGKGTSTAVKVTQCRHASTEEGFGGASQYR